MDVVMDAAAVGRLWSACQKSAPWVRPHMVLDAIRYKLPDMKGARSTVAVLISTVPAILAAWGPVGVP
jgi:hypothetical protein